VRNSDEYGSVSLVLSRLLGGTIMPNGKPGDHPVNDMFLHGAHPYPADIEEMIRRLAHIDPMLLEEIDRDVFEWEAGRGLEQARGKLQELIAKARPNPIFGEKSPV
jgi:hypothetical protein